ncbi:MAG: PTS system mannose/fructose/N-acetylgalactosamine-transporter subunit IIB [Longimicrobiales bacterium]
MPVVLYRVDERLIHGQVVVGWGHELRPDRYIVVDDDIAESSWEQELYALGAPEAEVLFTSIAQARERLRMWDTEPVRSVLLTRTVAAMYGLLDGQGGHFDVNLGGLHAGSDRIPVLDYLHLTARDREDLNVLAGQGVTISGRSLPDAPKVPLDTILSS